MGGNAWMVDVRGGVKSVPLDIVPEKKREGWEILSNSEFGADGKPKQYYYPAYDRENKTFVKVPQEIYVTDSPLEVLKTEVF